MFANRYSYTLPMGGEGGAMFLVNNKNVHILSSSNLIGKLFVCTWVEMFSNTSIIEQFVEESNCNNRNVH